MQQHIPEPEIMNNERLPDFSMIYQGMKQQMTLKLSVVALKIVLS